MSVKFLSTKKLEKRKRDNRIAGILLFGGVLLFSFLIDPRNVGFLSCYLKNSTGHACPTCGMSRSFYAMSQFNFAEALDYHLLGPLLYIFLGLLFVKFLTEVISNREIVLLKKRFN